MVSVPEAVSPYDPYDRPATLLNGCRISIVRTTTRFCSQTFRGLFAERSKQSPAGFHSSARWEKVRGLKFEIFRASNPTLTPFSQVSHFTMAVY